MGKQNGSYDSGSRGPYRRLRPGPGLSREQVAADQQSRLRRAVVEIACDHGYGALTVRTVAKRACLSSSALYSHYRSTDDCFLAAFDLICRQASEKLISVGKMEQKPPRRLVCALERLFQDVVEHPRAATFILRAAPAAGPAFTGRLRKSEMQIGISLAACLRANGGPQLPPTLLEGVVAGLARVGRRLLEEGGDAIETVAAEAAAWIMCLCLPSAAAPDCLLPPLPLRQSERLSFEIQKGGTPRDDRAMILAAAFQIAKRGYHELSIPRICREAGVTRPTFHRHFLNAEECVSSAMADRVSRLVAGWLRNAPADATWKDTVFAAARALVSSTSDCPDAARLLLVETSAPGIVGIESYDRQISQVAHILRAAAPAGQKPSKFAAEASVAAASAILGLRFSQPASVSAASLVRILVFLTLSPSRGEAPKDQAMDRLRAMSLSDPRHESRLVLPPTAAISELPQP